MQSLSQRLLLQPEVPAGALRCVCAASRCHPSGLTVCLSLSAAQAYWPFHKAWCRQNDFADAVEKTEPKFARWMRKHGKLAVLKDDEVDRIERKARLCPGPGVQAAAHALFVAWPGGWVRRTHVHAGAFGL